MMFFIRDDAIQVDKAIYFLRHEEERLAAANKELAQENKQLKNRPDTVYDPPRKGTVVRLTKGGVDMDMPVSKWNTHHFLRLFQNLYTEKYEPLQFDIKGKQWEVFSIRLSQFRRSHEDIQDNEAYKEMIEWLFAKKFNKKFIATIPLISSDTMLYQWLATTKSQSRTDPEEFKRLAAQTPKSTKALDKAVEDAF